MKKETGIEVKLIEPSILSWSIVIYFFLTSWLFAKHGNTDGE